MTYPFRLPNFKHQQDEWDRFKDSDARGLLWQMRTGKTKAILDLACYRFEKGDIDGVLVLAPNGVHVNWVRRQLPVHMWERVSYAAHAWQSSEAHKPVHAQSMDKMFSAPLGKTLAIFTVNSESIIHDKPAKLIAKFLKKMKGRCMLVVDESHDFRSPGSRRTKRAQSLKNYCKIRRILTGTSVSNSPMAAYSQFGLLEKGALGYGTFADFEGAHAQYVQKKTRGGKSYMHLERYVDLDGLQGKIAKWASVVLREDVDDMPALLKTTRTIVPTEMQAAAYQTLLKTMILELENGSEVEAIEGGARLIKLQQILSGFAIDVEGNVQTIVDEHTNPRLLAMLDEVQSATGKVIVWCKYREDIKRVVAKLTEAGIGCVEYHGAIHSQAKRQQAIDLFNNGPEKKVFVGQPKAGGSGLDLSVAELIVWYSHTFDLIERDQANERATQVGGKTITITDFVVDNSVDEYILATLENKRGVAESLAGRGLRDRLLAMFRAQL